MLVIVIKCLLKCTESPQDDQISPRINTHFTTRLNNNNKKKKLYQDHIWVIYSYTARPVHRKDKGDKTGVTAHQGSLETWVLL